MRPDSVITVDNEAGEYVSVGGGNYRIMVTGDQTGGGGNAQAGRQTAAGESRGSVRGGDLIVERDAHHSRGGCGAVDHFAGRPHLMFDWDRQSTSVDAQRSSGFDHQKNC